MLNRVMLLFSGASILLLTFGVAAAWYVHRLQMNTSEMLDSNVTSMRSAEEFEISIRELRHRITRRISSGPNPPAREVDELIAQTDHWLAEAERVATTASEQSWMRQCRLGYGRFLQEMNQLTARTLTSQVAGDLEKRIDSLVADEIIAPAHEYLDFNEQAVQQMSKSNQALADRLVMGFLTLGGCGSVAGLIAGSGLAWRLQRNKQEAFRAQQLAAVGQIAAGIAHEVRNPLTAIKMLVQGAVEKGSAGQLRGRHLLVLEEEVIRLERLISSFLEFARPPRPEKRPADLGRMVNEALELLAASADLQAVSFVADIPSPPTIISADPGLFRQLLFNLLTNALEASPPGGTVTVKVNLGALGPNHSMVELTVADAGPGLPAGLGDRIFEPFVSTKETGLGLGLSICRRIANDHGAELRAANRPSGGAIFIVKLPQSTVLDMVSSGRGRNGKAAHH